jgi:vitamin B12 transporter
MPINKTASETSLKKNFVYLLCFTFIVIISAAIPAAADDPVELEPVVITSERIPIPESRVTPNVTVITQEDIEDSGADSLGEILQDYAGVTFQQSGSLGKESAVRVRGSGSAQTLFLLNGLPMSDPSNGSANFNAVSMDNVERIEVVRGGVSSLYGSEGMNGVINIITKKPGEKPATRVKQSYGSFSTFESSLTTEGKGELGGWRLFAENLKSDGVRVNDDYTRRTLGADFTMGDDEDRLDLNLQAIGSENGLSIGWGGATDEDDRQNDRNFFGNISWQRKFSDSASFTANVFHRTVTNSYIAPGPFSSTYALTKSKSIGFDIQFNHRFKKTDGAIGVDYETPHATTEFPDWLTSAPITASRGWRSSSLFVNTVTTLPRGFSLSAGARYDDQSNFGTELNPKFTLSKAFHGGFSSYASTGNNFRAPTFNDLYYPNYGNPDLEPERSTYREFGLKYEPGGRFSASLSVFNNKYRGLIQPTLIDPVNYIYAPMNISSARISGLEVETSIYPGRNIEYSLNYTHLDSKNYDTGTEINRAPSDEYGLRVSFRGNSPWRWTLRGRTVSSIYDTAVSEDVGGYTVFDGKIVYSKLPGKSYFIEGNNISDEDYSMIADYPAPGASVRIGTEIGM